MNVDKILEKKFNKIYHGTHIPFVPLKQYETWAQNIDQTMEENNLFQEQKYNKSWSKSQILLLLKRGFNIAALETTLISVDLLVSESLKEIVGDRPIRVAQIGCRSGWSTLLLYRLLKSFYNDEFIIYSSDMSPYAIASTIQIMKYFNIPYTTTCRAESFSDNGNSQVVLCLNNEIDFLNKFKDGFLHAVYSNHGTAYLSIKKYLKVLQLIERKLVKSGSYIVDSLNLDLYLNLDKRHVVLGVIRGSNVRRSNRYSEGTVVVDGGVKILAGLTSSRFMDFLHEVVIVNPFLLKKYLETIASSVESQKFLRSMVNVPSSDLKVLSKYEKLEIPLKLKKLPDFFNKKYSKEFPYIQTVWLQK